MPIAIALVEDNLKTREGLVEFLKAETRVQCVGLYPTGEAAVREIPRVKPDVALVDINLPGMSGIECVAQLKKQLPKLQVLMLTKYEDSDMIFNSLRAGASGYLLKKMLTVELVSAIEQVHAGGSPMTMQIARKVVDYFNRLKPPASDLEKLTPREQEVLALLAKGFLYKEIGDRLGISFHTFRAHQRTIYEKLHVHSRTEAALKYFGKD
jgi:DNA-binding NarL/FixJ family response regulator